MFLKQIPYVFDAELKTHRWKYHSY